MASNKIMNLRVGPGRFFKVVIIESLTKERLNAPFCTYDKKNIKFVIQNTV